MRYSTLFIVLGLIAILGGVLALVNPFAASLAVTTLIGIFFLIGGAGQMWLAFSNAAFPHRMWTGIVGLVAVIAGVSLLADPLGGLITLTVLLGVLLVITGLGRLMVAFALRTTPIFWLLLLTGAVSVLIGGMILGNIAAAATTLLGVVLGIQLLFDGVALTALGIATRKID